MYVTSVLGGRQHASVPIYFVNNLRNEVREAVETSSLLEKLGSASAPGKDERQMQTRIQ